MSFLTNLGKQFPNVVLVDNTSTSTSPRSHPRQNVLDLLEHSVAYLNDSNYKLTGRNGKKKKPELCYKDVGTQYAVSLKYAREIIFLDGSKQRFAMVGNEADLKGVIGLLKDAVEAKEYDAQLEKIKKKRSEAIKARKGGAKPDNKSAPVSTKKAA